MTADTPTPYVPPDGVILTTMSEARRIVHGEVRAVRCVELDGVMWGPATSCGWSADNDWLVWWRPTPERTVTIELPESVARDAAEGYACWDEDTYQALSVAIQDAVARLDGES